MNTLPWKRGSLWVHAGPCTALMLAVPMVLAATRPVTTVAPDAVCHGSVREAAIAGIRVAAEMGWRVEYGGAVFERGQQCFVHSEPVTSNLPNRVEYTIRTRTGQMLLAGVYHTHTPGRHASEFSACDQAEQRRLGVPSYLGIIGARRGSLTIRSLGDEQSGNKRSRPAVQFEVVCG
jgi:hypothetical protein